MAEDTVFRIKPHIIYGDPRIDTRESNRNFHNNSTLTDQHKNSGNKRISFTSAFKRHSTKFQDDLINHDQHIFQGPSFDGGLSTPDNIHLDIKNPVANQKWLADQQSSKQSITEQLGDVDKVMNTFRQTQDSFKFEQSVKENEVVLENEKLKQSIKLLNQKLKQQSEIDYQLQQYSRQNNEIKIENDTLTAKNEDLNNEIFSVK